LMNRKRTKTRERTRELHPTLGVNCKLSGSNSVCHPINHRQGVGVIANSTETWTADPDLNRLRAGFTSQKLSFARSAKCLGIGPWGLDSTPAWHEVLKQRSLKILSPELCPLPEIKAFFEKIRGTVGLVRRYKAGIYLHFEVLIDGLDNLPPLIPSMKLETRCRCSISLAKRSCSAETIRTRHRPSGRLS
jgi:hypothetical protein